MLHIILYKRRGICCHEKEGDRMEHQQTQANCKSVFKSGENTPLKKQFTKKWIELINRIEKNKRATAGKR